MNEEDFLLKILLASRYSQTISEVAQTLFVGQPYVSRTLKKNEEKYGLTFINRKTKPIQLTAAGQMLIQNLQKVLNTQNKMEQSLRHLQQQELGTICIAVNQPFLVADISKAVTEAYLKFPEVSFRIVNQIAETAEENLTQSNLDILIGRKWNNPSFSIHMLPAPQLYLLLPDTCVLYQKDRLFCPFSQDNLSSLNNCNYVGLSDHSLFQKRVNLALRDNGILVKEILDFPDVHTATSTALQLHATTITTESIAREALGKDARFNLMPLPSSFLHSEFAISHLKDANDTIKKISTYLSRTL